MLVHCREQRPCWSHCWSQSDFRSFVILLTSCIFNSPTDHDSPPIVSTGAKGIPFHERRRVHFTPWMFWAPKNVMIEDSHYFLSSRRRSDPMKMEVFHLGPRPVSTGRNSGCWLVVLKFFTLIGWDPLDIPWIFLQGEMSHIFQGEKPCIYRSCKNSQQSFLLADHSSCGPVTKSPFEEHECPKSRRFPEWLDKD